jgi:hypothetical protein
VKYRRKRPEMFDFIGESEDYVYLRNENAEERSMSRAVFERDYEPVPEAPPSEEATKPERWKCQFCQAPAEQKDFGLRCPFCHIVCSKPGECNASRTPLGCTFVASSETGEKGADTEGGKA